ncbi:hypothetical protein LINGRAHAP2_LOCUS33404 [Linum grandiflorum]
MGRIASEIINGDESNSPSRLSPPQFEQHYESYLGDQPEKTTNQTQGNYDDETLQIWEKLQRSNSSAANGNATIIDRRLSRKRTNRKNQVLLEGYVDLADDDLKRGKSLNDDDLDELKGCLDLGFGGFSYDEIPELCNTLPALELCYSMSQKYLDDTSQKTPSNAAGSSDSSDLAPSDHASPIANWKISSPGDHPEDVKARLKYWAQAVACTVKLCS